MSHPESLAPHLKSAHRRALMATARIACLATLVGCAPKTSEPATSAAPSPASEATEQAIVDAPTPTSVASCEETIDTAFADGTDPMTVGDDVKACCQTVAEAADAIGPFDTFTFAHRDECCAALEWQGSMACTPWGPPTPPAMTA